MSTNASPLAAALFGKSMRAILGLLYGRPDRRFYVREIARAAGMTPSSLQRQLATLQRAGIIERSEEGRQVYYRADSRCPIFGELKAIAAKTFGVAEVLRAVLRPRAKRIRAAFIYGSVAKGTAAAGSDIDLLVIGEVAPSEIAVDLAQARQRLGREVSLLAYSSAEFAALAAQGNAFVTRVLEGSVIWLIGDRETVDGLRTLESRKPRARKAAQRGAA
ncbi:MAG: helix-turn-helix domain-containing protein [Betaproteobacteria bacterium]|nr:helix-turn-helix domain-containing protein [Betaproteobacteria bacterium]